jgi:hypothetical protein
MSELKVRAKFKCDSVESFSYGGSYAKLSAVIDDSGDNKDFTEATPHGNLEIGISDKTSAATFFKPGGVYYLDFTEAPENP